MGHSQILLLRRCIKLSPTIINGGLNEKERPGCRLESAIVARRHRIADDEPTPQKVNGSILYYDCSTNTTKLIPLYI